MQGYSPKIPLTKDSTDGLFSMNKTALESIKQDLKMLVLTSPGERIMLPDYGVGIRKFLFQQKTDQTFQNLRSAINSQVSLYMKFISIKNIEISEDENDENAINVSITYSVPTINTNQELNLSLGSN